MNSAQQILLLLALSSGLAQADTRPFVIRDRDANSITWIQTNELGQVTSSFVELATGGSRINPKDGTWTNADATIQIVQGPEGGAVAQKGRHRLSLSADANSQNATVDVEMPGGQRIQLQTIGIALTSLDNSRSMFIGEVKQSVGQQVDANTVIYPDAFAPIKGSLRLKNTLAGLESDVILEEKIDPADWNFQANDCKLEVWTQILQSPAAHIKTEKIPGRRAGDADQDHQISYDNMAFAKGTAFQLDNLLPGQSEKLAQIRVAKELAEFPAENLSFLIEAIPFLEAKSQIDTLPVEEARLKPAKDLLERAVVKNTTGKRARPNSLLAQAHPKGPKNRAMASLSNTSFKDKPGFVMDYSILTSSAGFTFKGDTTYYINGNVNLTGTTTIEGGAVLKFTNSIMPSITVGGPVVCTASSYRPAVITAKDDNSVGELIPGSTGNPTAFSYYALRPLDLTYAAFNSVQHLLVRYAFNGVTWHGGGGEVRHSQFYHCQHAIESSSGGTVFVRNVLIHDCESHFVATGASLAGENVTMDGGVYGFNNLGGSVLTLANSIIYGVTTPGIYTGVNNFTGFSTSPFQSVGGGKHYLANGSSLRDAGTATISADLLKDLKQMTTEPPVDVTGDFSNPTVLYPVVRRDTDVIDVGYHYDPLDYRWSDLNLNATTLTLTNGVAVGIYGGSGLQLRNGSVLVSQGTPNQLNRLVRYNSVQEMPLTSENSPTAMLTIPAATAVRPIVRMRFTDVSLIGPGASGSTLLNAPSYYIGELSLTDCQLRGTAIKLWEQVGGVGLNVLVALTNNVFERCSNYLSKAYYAYDVNLTLNCYNNLFYGGYTVFSYDNHPAYNPYWNIKDNHFDSVGLIQNGSGVASCILKSNNAYQSTTSLGGSGNVPLTSFSYATGLLGRWYQGAVGLVNAGSRSASNAGLYHYTTQTSQSKEYGTLVDIGFHYVVTDAAGTPMDSDGDLLADYREDRNGDNVVNTGETSFSSPDTDFDGVSDADEARDGTDPLLASSVKPKRLGRWRFDSNASSDAGVPPLTTQNLFYRNGWQGNCLNVDLESRPSVPGLRLLGLAEIQNGRPIVNPRNGTVSIWISPSWGKVPGSVTTPATSASQASYRLFGLQGADSKFWGMEISGNGLILTFSVHNGTAQTAVLTTTLPSVWTYHSWHQVVLSYTSPQTLPVPASGSVTLYVDGVPIATQTQNPLAYASWGFSASPRQFWVGGDKDGLIAHATYDELETYNYALGADDVKASYDMIVRRDSDHDGLTDMEEVRLGLQLNNPDTDGDGMVDGWEVTWGLNPLVSDAGSNPDSDNFTNWQEFLNGLNPLLNDNSWIEPHRNYDVVAEGVLLNVDFGDGPPYEGPAGAGTISNNKWLKIGSPPDMNEPHRAISPARLMSASGFTSRAVLSTKYGPIEHLKIHCSSPSTLGNNEVPGGPFHFCDWLSSGTIRLPYGWRLVEGECAIEREFDLFPLLYASSYNSAISNRSYQNSWNFFAGLRMRFNPCWMEACNPSASRLYWDYTDCKFYCGPVFQKIKYAETLGDHWTWLKASMMFYSPLDAPGQYIAFMDWNVLLISPGFTRAQYEALPESVTRPTIIRLKAVE